MTTNGYHPLARCPEAARLYDVWVKIAYQSPKKSNKKRREALEEYIAHIQGGCNCRRGLDNGNNDLDR